MDDTRTLSSLSQIKSGVLDLVLREREQNGRAETLPNCPLDLRGGGEQLAWGTALTEALTGGARVQGLRWAPGGLGPESKRLLQRVRHLPHLPSLVLSDFAHLCALIFWSYRASCQLGLLTKVINKSFHRTVEEPSKEVIAKAVKSFPL